MLIARAFIDVANPDGSIRRVHYRRAGSGPPLLLVHQSPRSSAEFVPLIGRWAAHFTVIAPDTPGFGLSAPLPLARPECEDYADAMVALLDALGLPQVAAYGFHSGAIILVTAAKRHPHRFAALACGGYAVWTEAEKAEFGAAYTPDFLPLPYGEHLPWLWGRVQEQSWFFPWYRPGNANRLPMATLDPAQAQPIVMDCLAAGNSFSLGYAAVLRANRDVPPPGAPSPPVLISAYDGDPLKAHIARLGDVPANWRIAPVATPAELEAEALAWLLAHPAPLAEPRAPDVGEGFVAVSAGGFEGLIHWRGTGDLWLHGPGSALTAAPAGTLALDLPGHGLSDPWADAPAELAPWVEVVMAALAALGAAPALVAGEGWSAVLASAVASRLGVAAANVALPPGDRDAWRARGIPDLAPDWAGTHLLKAWRMLRAETCFAPWFHASPATARAFDPAQLAPERLAVRHLALMRASAARPLLHACLDAADAAEKI
ncbi:alpha/beta fold hydrolase [Thermaurantiacus sp.]